MIIPRQAYALIHIAISQRAQYRREQRADGCHFIGATRRISHDYQILGRRNGTQFAIDLVCQIAGTERCRHVEIDETLGKREGVLHAVLQLFENKPLCLFGAMPHAFEADPLDSDRCCERNCLDNLAVEIRRLARLAIVIGKGAEHASVTRFDRH